MIIKQNILNKIKCSLTQNSFLNDTFQKLLLLILIIILPINSMAFARDSLNITSEAAIIIEQTSGRILYEKNANEKMYPASLTKVATAIYAIEKGNLEDIVTVSRLAREADGTRVYLEEGEKVPLKKLIQGMLINSGNDAAIAIAEHIDGTVEKFSENINSYLKNNIGVINTHFENPSGLFAADHTTSASDLALITQYAMKNEEFKTIFGTKELKWVGESWDTTIITHHKLMREKPYEGVTGGKTGYVSQSGNTLITSATRGDMAVIVVILKGQSQKQAYNDTVLLLDYAFDNYRQVSIPKGKEYIVNNQTFITKDALSFPIANHEEMIEKISNQGNLKFLNQDRELIFSTLLNKVQNDEEIKHVPKENANLFMSNYIFIIYIFSVIAIYSVTVVIRSKN